MRAGSREHRTECGHRCRSAAGTNATEQTDAASTAKFLRLSPVHTNTLVDDRGERAVLAGNDFDIDETRPAVGQRPPRLENSLPYREDHQVAIDTVIHPPSFDRARANQLAHARRQRLTTLYVDPD